MYFQFHPLIKWERASAIYLPEAGDPRFDRESSAVPVLVKTFVVSHGKRSRSHQAHVTLQDVDELGQFIDADFSQDFSYPGDTWIILDLEHRPARLIEVFKLGLLLLCVLNHCSKLV